jgi:MtN3 and saliva related transmembrane protein
LRIWRNGSAKDVSLTMYLMMFTGSVLWAAYGLLIGSFAIIVANLAAIVLVGSVVVLKIKDMMRPAPMPAPVVADRV